MLAIVPRTLATSQGAYASEMQVHAATSTLRLRSPDLYVDWEVDKLKPIRWDSTGTLTGTPVRIELWQDGPNGPAFRATIVAQTQDDGEFIWMPSQSGVAAGEKGLRIKVLHVGAPQVFDLTTETFSVPELGNTYYVDDGSNDGDVFTPGAIGSNRNTGKLATAPKPNPVNVLRTYDLVAGSTLYVDTGNYPMIYGLTVSGQSDLGAGIGIEEGFSILGPSSANAVARLYSANAAVTLDALVDITNADFMTISHLTLENAKRGVRAGGGSDDLTLGNITVEGFTVQGFTIETQSAGRSFSNLVARGTGDVGFNFTGSLGALSDMIATARQTAIRINGTVGSIEDIEVYGARTGLDVTGTVTSFRTIYAHDNTDYGAYLALSGGSTIESSRFINNSRYGLYVSANGAGAANRVTVGAENLARGAGNRVDGSGFYGIVAGNNVDIIGNTVTGTANYYAIDAGNGRVMDNVVTAMPMASAARASLRAMPSTPMRCRAARASASGPAPARSCGAIPSMATPSASAFRMRRMSMWSTTSSMQTAIRASRF